MWLMGAYLIFASLFLATIGGAGQSGFVYDNQSAIELWYGLVVVVGGLMAIRWFKAAVVEALLAGIPIALVVASTISDHPVLLDRTVVGLVAPFCVISLVGFAIRVLAMPEPADKPQVSGLT
jgi:hypothetical protein